MSPILVIKTLMRLQVSRSLALTSGQLLVNLFLASWLVSEYLHNQYLQQYLSDLWSTDQAIFATGIGLAVAVVLGSYLATSRGIVSVDIRPTRQKSDAVTTNEIKALDVCPVCNGGLKELSKNRYLCRSCHRYFKK